MTAERPPVWPWPMPPATSGSHHTRAWTIAKEMKQGKNWSDEEKVDLVIYHQSLRPLFDMLGVCRLPSIKSWD